MKKRISSFLSLFFIGIFCILINSVIAKAGKQEYISVDKNSPQKTTRQLNNSVLIIETSDKKADITVKSENGDEYVSTFLPESHLIIRDKHKLYFVRYTESKPEIVQYNTDTSEETVLKRFGKEYYLTEPFPLNLILEHTDSKHLYYSLRDIHHIDAENFPVFDIYRIETNTLKGNLVVKDACLTEFVSNRMLYFDCTNDYGPMPLHSVLLNGKNKKTLNQGVLRFQVIKDKIYFVASNLGSDDYYVFRANTDFSKIKKLSKVIKKKPFENLKIGKITDKKVYYEAFDYSESGTCDYCFVIDLKTKKVKRIEKSLWEVIK